LRGKTLVADGKLHQAKGVGRYLKRAKSQDASMGLESSISIK
jgi:hypothetical protein